MKRSKFSEEQVAYALRQVEAGTAVAGHLPPARRQRSDVLREAPNLTLLVKRLPHDLRNRAHAIVRVHGRASVGQFACSLFACSPATAMARKKSLSTVPMACRSAVIRAGKSGTGHTAAALRKRSRAPIR